MRKCAGRGSHRPPGFAGSAELFAVPFRVTIPTSAGQRSPRVELPYPAKISAGQPPQAARRPSGARGAGLSGAGKGPWHPWWKPRLGAFPARRGALRRTVRGEGRVSRGIARTHNAGVPFRVTIPGINDPARRRQGFAPLLIVGPARSCQISRTRNVEFGGLGVTRRSPSPRLTEAKAARAHLTASDTFSDRRGGS